MNPPAHAARKCIVGCGGRERPPASPPGAARPLSSPFNSSLPAGAPAQPLTAGVLLLLGQVLHERLSRRRRLGHLVGGAHHCQLLPRLEPQLGQVGVVLEQPPLDAHDLLALRGHPREREELHLEHRGRLLQVHLQVLEHLLLPLDLHADAGGHGGEARGAAGVIGLVGGWSCWCLQRQQNEWERLQECQNAGGCWQSRLHTKCCRCAVRGAGREVSGSQFNSTIAHSHIPTPQ